MRDARRGSESWCISAADDMAADDAFCPVAKSDSFKNQDRQSDAQPLHDQHLSS